MSRQSIGNSIFRRFAVASLCLFSFLLASQPVWSQEITAAVSGVITDPSGAAVADAKVTAKDSERGSTFSTTTNGTGAYNLPRLPVGTYELRVEKTGFQAVVRSGILLQLNQAAELDFTMTIGSVTQTVDVTSAAPILQTETTQLGTVIDSRENAALPLSTRNYVQLTLLATGAVTSNPAGFGGSKTSFQSERPYVNGNREQTNNFLLDGLDNNQVSDNLVAYAPSVDAIEEFNMITQNASAEFGNFMGGIISVSIKAGTNQIHGTAFEFFRNDALNANTWENNWKIPGIPRSLLRWNQFGGSAGGAIIKDKLFLFGDYQGSRYDIPASTNTTSVFTTAERAGNFSGVKQQLYNPFSVTNGTRSVFAGNIIPLTLINPTAAKILNSSLYPQPTNPNLTSNLTYQSHSYTNGDQGDIRGDYNKSDNDHFFVRYSQANITNPTTNSLPLIYGSFGDFRIHNGAFNYTRTLSPSLVNEFRAGVNYNFNNTGSNPGSATPASLGIPGVPINIIPGLVLSGGNASTIGSADNISLFADTVIQLSDTLIWTKGQHNFKFGFQAFRERLDTFYSGNNGAAGTITFDGQYTAGPTNTQKATATAGIAEADFFLGLPSAIGVGTNGGTWGQRGNIFGAFAQDTWRVNKNLTLNYGLRWELHTPWVEVDNRQANFTPFGGQQIIAGTGSTYYGNSRALYNQYNGAFNFQPRLGIAYTMGNTVIRASYTLSSFLEGTGTNLRLTINPPFAVEKNADYTALTLPSSTLDQGYIPIQSKTDPFAAATLRLWDPNFRPAVSQQWNFSLQHQFGSNTTLQAAYVGQKNDHLVVAQPYLQKQLLANGTVVNSPYLSGNPTLQADLYNTKGQISGTEANGNQEYDALQVTLQQRLAHGLSGQLGYTWSKCMEDSIGFYGGGTLAANASAYVQNLYNRAAEWAPCFIDLTHVITGHLSYDLPIGRGRAFGKNMNRAVDAVVGGWQLNSIVSIHGGFPITETATDASGTNARSARANCLSAPTILGESVDANLSNSPSVGGYRYFINNNNFTQPANGTFGNCGIATIRAPGYAETDLSVSKKFNITEKKNIEFRSEWINAMNSVLLQVPTHSVSSTSNGVITASTLPRNIQFGMKFNF